MATILCALLAFLNACEAESDATDVFRSAQYAETDLDSVLTARHADQVSHIQVELGSLIVGSLGAVAVLVTKRVP